MTQRTEGLVTYWQETTRANVTRDDWGTVAEVTQDCGRFRVSTASGISLGEDEARALRDAITVMLGDAPLAPCCQSGPGCITSAVASAGERIIARLTPTEPCTTEWNQAWERGINYAIGIVREECGVAE